jgi:HSP20 family protein
MSIVKFNKNSSLPNPYDLLEDFFNTGIAGVNRWLSGYNFPAVNIQDVNDAYLVCIAAPGINKEDFKVELHDDVLTVSSELKKEKESNEGGYMRKEFNWQSFKRSFRLPIKVAKDKVEATYNDGILKIKLPKQEVANKEGAKQIVVK